MEKEKQNDKNVTHFIQHKVLKCQWSHWSLKYLRAKDTGGTDQER